ncbi:hypothetical protein BZZ08_07159 [Streptomyces sp. MH60]|nr:hypothetical protein BZZ08_07159 [Streptomyces sp. MH60]
MGLHGFVVHGQAGELGDLVESLHRTGVVEVQHRLEEGVPGQRAFRVDGLDQPLERHVLVGVGGEVGRPHPLQQLREGGVPGDVGAQHQRVHEEADQIVQRVVGAAGDRGAQGDVRARTQPGQQRGQARLEHHEQAGAAVTGHAGQTVVEFRRELEGDDVTAMGGHGRPGAVEGQGQFLGKARQRLLPVVELPAGLAVRVVLGAEDDLLPDAVVGVLDRQRRPLRGGTPHPGRVRRRQVAGQRGPGPGVGRHVVGEQQQDVLVAADLEQGGPKGRFGGQVEGVARGLGEIGGQPGGVAGHDGEGRARLVQHDLMGSLGVLGEDRAEGFVPCGQVGEGVLQRRTVEGPGQAEGDGGVVGGAGALEAVQEPQPALGVGQGQPLGAREHGGDRRACGAVSGVEGSGQAGDGGGLEELPDGHLGTECRADAADEFGGEQGVAAQGEEVVVDGDRADAQHLGEEGAENVLAGGARGPSATRLRPVVGGGQGAAVQLAVRGEREGVQDHEGGRHHVVGEPVGGQGAQGVG